MPIDLTHHLGAVTRTVASDTRDGVPVRIITAERRYATDIDDLWDALTSVERIPRWFLPVSGDLQVGGRFQFQGNAGGEILSCDKPHRFGITWGMQGQVSWVNVTLTADGPDATLLELEHIAPVPEEFWTQYGPGAVGVGWEGGLLGLALHVVGDASVTPETAMQWSASEEGRAFYTGSSVQWGEASIASGTDATAARAAAARTTAFYTGAPPT